VCAGACSLTQNSPPPVPSAAAGPQRFVYHEHFGLTNFSLDALVAEGGEASCSERFETFFDTPKFDLLNENMWLRCCEYIDGNNKETKNLEWTLKIQVSSLFCV